MLEERQKVLNIFGKSSAIIARSGAWGMRSSIRDIKPGEMGGHEVAWVPYARLIRTRGKHKGNERLGPSSGELLRKQQSRCIMVDHGILSSKGSPMQAEKVVSQAPDEKLQFSLPQQQQWLLSPPCPRVCALLSTIPLAWTQSCRKYAELPSCE